MNEEQQHQNTRIFTNVQQEDLHPICTHILSLLIILIQLDTEKTERSCNTFHRIYSIMLSTRLLSVTPRGLMAFSPSAAARYSTTCTMKTPSCLLTKHSILRQQGMMQNRRNLTSKTGTDAIKKETIEAAQSSAPKAAPSQGSFLQRWMAHKEIPIRGTFKWYGEMVLLCTVFAITGTSTMVLVRPAVSEVLGLKGSLKEGPWSYRVCSIVIMTPVYSAMLVLVGVSALLLLTG